MRPLSERSVRIPQLFPAGVYNLIRGLHLDLTIVDMLELLEREIVALRTRSRELQVALERRGQIESLPASPKKRKTARNKRSRKTASNKTKGSKLKGEQLSLPALEDESKPEQETRQLGKRQALGKSLIQLRRTAAPRPL
jgi:hypothetical protein